MIKLVLKKARMEIVMEMAVAAEFMMTCYKLDRHRWTTTIIGRLYTLITLSEKIPHMIGVSIQINGSYAPSKTMLAM